MSGREGFLLSIARMHEWRMHHRRLVLHRRLIGGIKGGLGGILGFHS
jgi:hypothetical protein